MGGQLTGSRSAAREAPGQAEAIPNVLSASVEGAAGEGGRGAGRRQRRISLSGQAPGPAAVQTRDQIAPMRRGVKEIRAAFSSGLCFNLASNEHFDAAGQFVGWAFRTRTRRFPAAYPRLRITAPYRARQLRRGLARPQP